MFNEHATLLLSGTYYFTALFWGDIRHQPIIHETK